MLAVIAAVLRGQDQWAQISWSVWAHMALISLALLLTPVMLWRSRGVWSVAMLFTALISFDIRQIEAGGFSYIHLLSVATLVLVPLLIWQARRHNVSGHRSAVRGLITGALLVAGFFTFPFNRLLGGWLLG